MSIDVAVVGAGITGLGVAVELATRGLKVTLFDAGAVGAATSANSHRVIHGGFRYLASGDLPRVLESQRDLSYLKRKYPDLVVDLACLMPLGRGLFESRASVKSACLLYRLLACMQGSEIPAPRVMRYSELTGNRELMPEARSFLSWHDGYLVSHEHLVERLVRELQSAGGSIFEKTMVQSVKRDLDGCLLVSTAGQQFRARCVVGCLGASAAKGPLAVFKDVVLVRAFNIVLKQRLPNGTALAAKSTSGRLFFLVPRPEGLALGTGYLPQYGECLSSEIGATEVEEFLAGATTAFNWNVLGTTPVIRVESGVLPVRRLTEAGPEFFGSSLIHEVEHGFWQILSTKYTGFPSTATRLAKLVGSYLKH